MAATTSFTSLPACRGRLRRRCVGRTQGGSSLKLADIAANARRGKNAAGISPIALEAVRRIDGVHCSEIERGINGAERRRAVASAA